MRSASYNINNSIFRIVYKDITQVEAEALVSSDGRSLSMSGGVARAILQAGGETIKQDAHKHTHLKIGDVIVTSAGNLPAKYIFHVVTLEHRHNTYINETGMYAATLKCMQLADMLGIFHLAFPALGTGYVRFPFQKAAEIMTRTIAEHLNKETQIELVTLALYASGSTTEDDLNLFYERAVALASISTQGKRLYMLMSELQNIIEKLDNRVLAENAIQLQSKLSQAETVLAGSPTTLAQIDELEESSGIAGISQQAVEISSQAQAAIKQDHRQLEAGVLQTKLSGLLTQLNIHYSNLNKLQVRKAKHGPLDVPLKLENAIEETECQIEETELQVDEIKKQIVNLTEGR